MTRSFFKFVPFERIDILENGLIRFSPVKDLNDPFEALPSITYFTDKKWEVLYKIIDKVCNRRKKHLTQDEEVFILSNFPNLDSLSFSKEDDAFSTERFYKLHKYKCKLRRHISQYGILSLISSDDVSPNISQFIGYPNDPRRNLLMWSHYTNSHKGFVIEFDEDFIENKPQKVTYTNERPILTFEEIDNFELSAYLIKSKEWEYENEYRSFGKLSNADNAELSLFKFDKTKIKSVTLGCNMSKENRDKIVSLLQNTPEYKNVSIFFAKQREDKFSLEFFLQVGSSTNFLPYEHEDGTEEFRSLIRTINIQNRP